MASFSPIAETIPNYRDFKNQFLKAFIPGSTTTPKVMATDKTGATTVAKFELDKDGFPKTSGGALVIPYISGPYDLWLFPTAAEADANDTVNAKRFAINIEATDANVLIDRLNPDTIAIAIADTSIQIGDVLDVEEYSTGSGGSGIWKAVDETTVTTNGANIRQSDTSTIALVLRMEGDVDVRSLGAVAGSDVSVICQIIVDAGFKPFFSTPFVTYVWDTTVQVKNKVGVKFTGKANLQATTTLYPNTSQKFYFIRFIDTLNSSVDGLTFNSIDGTVFDGSKRCINVGSTTRSSFHTIENCTFVNFRSQPIVLESVDEEVSAAQPANISNEFSTVRFNLFSNSTGGVITLNGGVKQLDVYGNTFDRPQLGIVKIDGENPPSNGEKCRDVRIYENKIVGSGTQAGITTAELFGCEENVKNISIRENDFYGVTSAEALILRDGQVPGTVESVIFSKNKFYDCVFADVVRTSITSTQITSIYAAENEFYTSTISATVMNIGTGGAVVDAVIEGNKIFGAVNVFVISNADNLRVENNFVETVDTEHILTTSGTVNLIIKGNKTDNSSLTVFDGLEFSGTLEYSGNDHSSSDAAKFLDINSTGSSKSNIKDNIFPDGVVKHLELTGASAIYFVVNNRFGTCTGDAILALSAAETQIVGNTFDEIIATFRAVNALAGGNASGLNNTVIRGIPNVANYTPLAAGNEF